MAEFALPDVEFVIMEASSDLMFDSGVFLEGLGILGSREG